MAWDILTLQGEQSISIRDFYIVSDSIEFDLEADRSPLSPSWFSLGTKDEKSATMTIKYSPNFRNMVDALQKISAVQNLLPSLTSITWHNQTRQVFGVVGQVQSTATPDQPFSIQFTVACKPGDWDGPLITGSFKEGFVKVDDGGVILALEGDFPDESSSIQRRTSFVSDRMNEEGDGLWNPTTITVTTTLHGGTNEELWSSMIELTELAQTADKITVNTQDIVVMGLLQISRLYSQGGAITVVLTFMLSQPIYNRDYTNPQWETPVTNLALFGYDYSMQLRLRTLGPVTFSKVSGDSDISISTTGLVIWTAPCTEIARFKASAVQDGVEIQKDFLIYAGGYPCFSTNSAELYTDNAESVYYEAPVFLSARRGAPFNYKAQHTDYYPVDRDCSYQIVQGPANITVQPDGTVYRPSVDEDTFIFSLFAVSGVSSRVRVYFVNTLSS